MIELNEKDIQAVGEARFMRRNYWKCFGSISGALLVSILVLYGVAHLIDLEFTPLIARIVICIVIAMIPISVMYAWLRGQNNAGKALLREWDKGKGE